MLKRCSWCLNSAQSHVWTTQKGGTNNSSKTIDMNSVCLVWVTTNESPFQLIS